MRPVSTERKVDATRRQKNDDDQLGGKGNKRLRNLCSWWVIFDPGGPEANKEDSTDSLATADWPLFE